MTKSYSIEETGSLPNSLSVNELNLHLAWIDGSFRVSISEGEKNEVLYFRQYSFQQTSGINDVLAELKEIVATDVLFGGTYRSVKVGVGGRMELTPQAYYKETTGEITGKLLNGEIIGSITPNNAEIEFYNAFFKQAEFELLPLKWVETIIPQATAHKLFVQIDGNILHIAYFGEPNRLKFYNTFEFKTFEDFAYFTNLVAESLELNRAELELVLSGDVAQQSQIYNVAYTYFQSVSFLQNSALQYAASFAAYPKHQNLALFSL